MLQRSRQQKSAKRFRNILAQNTNEFCDNTTLHGLKYIASKSLNPIERSFFAISVIVVLMVSCFFISEVYEKWNTTPVIFGLNPDPTFVTKEPFPAVTVCNLNQALKAKAVLIPKNSTKYAMLQFLCKRKVNKAATAAASTVDWSTLEQFIVNVSQSCEDMIVACRFGAKNYDCTKYFHQVVTDEGLCCVFNILHPKFMFNSDIPLTFGKFTVMPDVEPFDWNAEWGYPKYSNREYYPLKAAGIGESLGMSLTLNAEYDKYYCSSSNSVGFKYNLYSPNELPNIREVGVLIPPGKESKVRIRPEKLETRQNLRSMKQKYRRCLFYNERTLRYFAHYTQRNCEIECLAEMHFKHCGCISFFMPKIYPNATICGLQQLDCVETVRLRLDPKIESCMDSCLPGCFDLTFYSDVFSTMIAHDGFGIVNHAVEHFNQSYAEKNIAVVHMYFREYSYRGYLQTEFIGFTDFLSSVGGLMGLFMGFSFISIAELVYFAVMRPICKYFQRRKINSVAGSRASLLNASKQLYRKNNALKLWKKYYTKTIIKRPTYCRTLIDNDLLRNITETSQENADFITIKEKY